MTPPEATAAAICVIARSTGHRGRLHPGKCRFCPDDAKVLVQRIKDFEREGFPPSYLEQSEKQRWEQVRAAAALPDAPWYEEVGA